MENAVERYENIAHVPWETMKTKNTTNGDNVNGFVVFFFWFAIAAGVLQRV